MSDKLILLTEADQPTLHVASLVEMLTRIGLIAEGFEFEGHSHHRAGDEFLNLITFLGCSPYVVLDPGAGEDFCHVRIYATGETQCIGRPGTTPPRCPQCRHKITDADAVIGPWKKDSAHEWNCPDCGTSLPPRAINWRHSAGFGNLVIEIWGIQPELAVPGDALQAQLKATCPTDWDYLFLSE